MAKTIQVKTQVGTYVAPNTVKPNRSKVKK